VARTSEQHRVAFCDARLGCQFRPFRCARGWFHRPPGSRVRVRTCVISGPREGRTPSGFVRTSLTNVARCAEGLRCVRSERLDARPVRRWAAMSEPWWTRTHIRRSDTTGGTLYAYPRSAQTSSKSARSASIGHVRSDSVWWFATSQ
jgi:hypothetical protein